LNFQQTLGFEIVQTWLAKTNKQPFAFQAATWTHIANGKSGLVNAPTGCGKTFSVFLGAIIQFISQHPNTYQSQKNNGLQLLWITPLRALSTDIARAMEQVLQELDIPWSVGIRNGDTAISERAKQKKQLPEILLITPESLMLLIASKNHAAQFERLMVVAVDEWHELMGGKRGVQVELALSRLVGIHKKLNRPRPFCLWGISATIGNLQQAADVLLSPIRQLYQMEDFELVAANIQKSIEVKSIFPDEIEEYPWAGHLGIKLAHKILPILAESKTTLIFINTRGMSETWYQTLLDIAPELSGAIALHHGSIERELRTWVEDALHSGTLKAVVCTASLDLGVDFRPVETVIQVGSPKGVARFLQRAGRAGHQPGEVSRIYFLPTHSLELLESAALQSAIEEKVIESKEPMLLCFDVLIQYLATVAVGDGFDAKELLPEIRATFCFYEMSDEEWAEIINFIAYGGKALGQYDEYKKYEVIDGFFKITSRRMAMRHRMQIGTIVSDMMLKVKFLSGGYVGVIEEYFISKLKPGDVFTLGGRNLALLHIKDMTAYVEKSNSKKSIIPSWQGGRMSLTANLGQKLREMMHDAATKQFHFPETAALESLLQTQASLSHVPLQDELLIELIDTKDGYHLFCYSFEGRMVNEAMATILAHRLARLQPLTFSFAMNDYGFELLCDQPIPITQENVYDLFTLKNLSDDIQNGVNSTEMAKRKFRDIAVIGGLIFQGMPGEQKKARHLQSSTSLLFKVFSEFDANNLLLRQAYTEVFEQQMEEARLRSMLNRIQSGKIIITHPTQLTPFCFPLKVDSIREQLSSEKLEDRVRRMQEQLR
jgi:ATP-dependent helicase Lhr and Lhr-like helicase